jgi:hypothetical protein
MNRTNFSNIDLLLYHQDKPVGVCKADYFGLLGMHVKAKNIVFPKDSSLEIEVIGPKKMGIGNFRIPVVVSSSSGEGFALRLKHFAPDLLSRWRQVLGRILFSEKNETQHNAIGAL